MIEGSRESWRGGYENCFFRFSTTTIENNGEFRFVNFSYFQLFNWFKLRQKTDSLWMGRNGAMISLDLLHNFESCYCYIRHVKVFSLSFVYKNIQTVDHCVIFK